MKKQFIIFLVLTFILGLIPFNFSYAITQNQINAEVQIVCTDGADNWFSGSGTIIDPKGIILTNRHVVEGAYNNICFIGFLESINQAPNFGSKDNPNLAEVKYITNTDDMDAAILYLDNPTNKNYPYINIYNSNSDILQFGDKLEVIGYPGIGGSTMTYTSGDFSGFGTGVDGTQNYIKATTPIEHGNSGGAAYGPAGQFLGIPTMVIAGSLNSLSYILSVNSIKKWLSDILGIQYQQQIIETKPIIEKFTINTQDDITPPAMFSASEIIFHNNETGKDINWNNIFEDGLNITVKWPDAVDENGIDGYYVYFGTNRNASVASDGAYTKEKIYSKLLDIPGIYYIMISARDKKGNISSPVIAQYNYKVYPDWITNNPMQYLLVTNRPTYFYVYDYSKGKKGNLLTTIKFDSSVVQNIKVPSSNLLIEWNGVARADFITKQEISFVKGMAWDRCGGPAWEIWKAWEKDPNNVSLTNEATAKQKKWDECMKSSYIEVTNNSFSKINLEVNQSYNFEYNYYFTYGNHINELGGFFNPFILTATKKTTYQNQEQKPSSNLNGYILLQVESHGEAWYVNPADGKRYYMKDGPTAYEMMRKFGLGITDVDLTKVPQEKEVNNNPSLVNRLKGKILLQVQQHGEAWYINPKTGYRYYMKDGEAAYNLMRFHSLGITNKDLEKIPEGNL